MQAMKVCFRVNIRRYPKIDLSMRIINYLLRGMAGVLVTSSLAMCAKSTINVDKPATTTPAKTTGTSAPAQGSGANPVLDLANTDSLTVIQTQSIDASCTYTVQPSEWMVDGTNIPPGSVICLPAGTRGALLLKNLKGTATKPIIIVNKGGKVTLSAAASASYVLKAQNCQYFKIRGYGAAGISYGIDINGGNLGVTMDDLSSDFELTNLEVRNSGFAGIMAKTDPTCDVATQRGHFTMNNVVIRSSYIHKTGGEGVYVGNSFYADGVSTACGKVLPHEIKNLKIYNLKIDSTGCEGIQVGSATTNVEVRNNRVRYPGLSPFASGQNNGIQIGEGTGGKCYGNYVFKAPGNGIILLGLGDNDVFDNIIVSAGANGIFADSRWTPGPYFRFVNNDIINPGADGIKMNSEIIPLNLVANNVIVKPGSGVAIRRMNNIVKLTTLNNYITDDINACQFVDAKGGNYHLQSTSPLINAGINALLYNVGVDYYGVIRPSGGEFDIGAAEYQ